jgi:hypothetical protein
LEDKLLVDLSWRPSKGLRRSSFHLSRWRIRCTLQVRLFRPEVGGEAAFHHQVGGYRYGKLQARLIITHLFQRFEDKQPPVIKLED